MDVCAHELTFALQCVICHFMDMTRIRKPINVTLAPELVEALDAFLARQTYKVTRAAFIEAAVVRELSDAEAKEKRKK